MNKNNNKAISAGRRKITAGQVIVEVIMLIFSVFMLIPFLWMFSTSLRLPKDSFNLPPAILPNTFNLNSYFEVFEKVPYLSFYLNSLKISCLVTFGVVVISTMAAYAFSRIEFPGRDVLFILMLTGIMVPIQVTIIPQFILMSKLGWMNKHVSLIIPILFSPIAIFLIRQFMKTISKSYEEAAIIEGAGSIRIFFSIIVPMSLPAISVAAVLTFVLSWNEFFRALIFLNTFEKMTIPIGITVLRGTYGSGNLSTILAGIMMSILATVIVFIFGQRYLIEGVAIGGVKE